VKKFMSDKRSDSLVGRRFRPRKSRPAREQGRVVDVERDDGVEVAYFYADRPRAAKFRHLCARSWFLEHHDPIGSTTMKILLMCQGQQRRLAKEIDHAKHLLSIGDEPILRRTLRLLHELGVGDHATVIGRRELAEAMLGWPMSTSWTNLTDPGMCIVDGILEALRLNEDPQTGIYPERTLILLGDVVWSRTSLAAFLADQRPVVFAGQSVVSPSQGEVFALGFDDPQAMKNLCETCPCRVDGKRQRVFKEQRGGHLRRLMWHYQDMHRLRVHPSLRRTWNESIYLPVDDWTNDIDTPEDMATLPELARLAELEERTRSAPAADLSAAAAP
jgi:hypothetical protein